jgi:hypothetical protein
MTSDHIKGTGHMRDIKGLIWSYEGYKVPSSYYERGGSPLALAHRADDIWSYEGYKVPSSSCEGARHSLSHTGQMTYGHMRDIKSPHRQMRGLATRSGTPGRFASSAAS